jgi:hypothetical protein
MANRAHWHAQLQARKSRAVLRENSKREQEMEALNTLGAQLDAIEVMTNGGIFINPVDRTALHGLLSALRKTTVSYEPSPLTRPTSAAADASSSRAGQGPAALRAANDWTQAAALEAKLSGTISYAHKWKQRRRGDQLQHETSGSTGGIRLSEKSSSTARENALRKRFIENAHWLDVHREQERQKEAERRSAATSSGGEKQQARLDAALKAARKRTQEV